MFGLGSHTFLSLWHGESCALLPLLFWFWRAAALSLPLSMTLDGVLDWSLMLLPLPLLLLPVEGPPFSLPGIVFGLTDRRIEAGFPFLSVQIFSLKTGGEPSEAVRWRICRKNASLVVRTPFISSGPEFGCIGCCSCAGDCTGLSCCCE